MHMSDDPQAVTFGTPFSVGDVLCFNLVFGTGNRSSQRCVEAAASLPFTARTTTDEAGAAAWRYHTAVLILLTKEPIQRATFVF